MQHERVQVRRADRGKKKLRFFYADVIFAKDALRYTFRLNPPLKSPRHTLSKCMKKSENR